jgi:peptidoglycan/xylan/chitin deacetylase (PgdA/CDA1 family)
VSRGYCSVSLDLDNLWSYMKTHGDPGWEARPTYLPKFIPRALDALARRGITITFFIVGLDAERPENADALRSIVQAGHEVGNHSHEHEPWLHTYEPSALEAEIRTAEEAIHSATGQRPMGFRGPGFSWSPTLLGVLAGRAYLYDASTFPSFLGPLARQYYFRTAKLSAEDRRQREMLFGSVREGLRPNQPYYWQLPDGHKLLEIPVTTMPYLKAPFHLSYLLFLARYSEKAMEAYLKLAIGLCRFADVEPSFLLHPLDLLGAEDAPELRFFPGMDIGREKKARLFDRALAILGDHFELVRMSTHARSILSRHGLSSHVPVLAS